MRCLRTLHREPVDGCGIVSPEWSPAPVLPKCVRFIQGREQLSCCKGKVTRVRPAKQSFCVATTKVFYDVRHRRCLALSADRSYDRQNPEGSVAELAPRLVTRHIPHEVGLNLTEIGMVTLRVRRRIGFVQPRGGQYLCVGRGP